MRAGAGKARLEQCEAQAKQAKTAHDSAAGHMHAALTEQLCMRRALQAGKARLKECEVHCKQAKVCTKVCLASASLCSEPYRACRSPAGRRGAAGGVRGAVKAGQGRRGRATCTGSPRTPWWSGPRS